MQTMPGQLCCYYIDKSVSTEAPQGDKISAARNCFLHLFLFPNRPLLDFQPLFILS